MTDTPEAVFEALRDNHERPHGPARVHTAEELVEAAEQFETHEVLVTALAELMTAYNHTGESRRSPVVFARLLRLYDTTPEAFDEGEVHQLYWYFKWVASCLLDVPDVPLAAVHGWADRMRERYEAAGHGLQPVAGIRHAIAAHTGVAREETFELWATRPRTDLSDCRACELRAQARHFLALGDDARALAVWEPVLTGRLTCAEEPYLSYAHALLPLLRSGRADEARSHHLTGYRFVRGRAGFGATVGLHLEFCALTRNTARGLEILAENRAMFDETGSPLARNGFLTGLHVLLARLAADGHGAVTAAGPAGRAWTVAELLEHTAAEGAALAAAFDARNGTGAVGDRRRARLAAAPLLDEPLPLGLRAALPAPRTAPVPPPPAPPEDIAGLLARARVMAAQGHPGDAPLWEGIARRAGADGYVHDPAHGPHARLRAELHEQRGLLAGEQDRPAECRAELLAAAEEFEDAAMPWHALRARARALCRPLPGPDGEPAADADADRAALDRLVGPARARLDADGPAAPLTPAAAEAAAADPDPATADAAAAAACYLAVVQCRLFAAHRLLLAGEEPDPAERARLTALIAELRAEGERLGAPVTTAVADQYAAELAGRMGELDEAAGYLDSALARIADAGHPWRAARPHLLYAHVRMAQQRHADAAESLRTAIAGAARHGDGAFPLESAYGMLGQALARTGDTAGAVRCLSDAAERHDRAGRPQEAARDRQVLAEVLVRAGQPGEAVAILEAVTAEAAAGAFDERLLAQLRLTLARGLRELGEHRASAEEFTVLAAAVAAWPDQATHALVAAEAAVALATADRWEQAAAAYRAAVTAHAADPNPGPVAEMMRRFARLVSDTEGPAGTGRALAHLAECDAVWAAVPAADHPLWYEDGRTRYERGRVLAADGRHTEALAELEASVARFTEGGPDAEAPRAESVRVAALVESGGLGRRAAALARLDAAAARCRAAGHPHPAEVLADLRARLAARAD